MVGCAAMSEPSDEEKGRTLLTAVERIVASNEKIRAVVSECEERAGDGGRDAAAREIIRHYSNRAAIAGGVVALPSLVPGTGAIWVALGGALAELGALLKFEVEMALALTHLHGFDIDKEEERQLAFLMASVGT